MDVLAAMDVVEALDAFDVMDAVDVLNAGRPAAPTRSGRPPGVSSFGVVLARAVSQATSAG